MGRHRRSAAGHAAPGRATGVTHPNRPVTGGEDPLNSYAGDRAPMGIAPYLNPEAYAEANARSTAYLYGEPSWDAAGGSGFTPAGGPPQGHRHRKRVAKPVRTGLLGVSAAVALGTVAVTTGAVPGLQHYQLGGGSHTTGGERVQAADSPSNTTTEQGGTSGSADSPVGGAPAGRGTAPSTSPTPSASASATESASASAAPTKKPSKKPKPAGKPQHTPSHKEPKAPTASSAPVTVSAQAAAEAEVLKLVNEERAKVGCSALAANSSLTGLAEAFSGDMAARDFFDHTDPDGATPWDRAAKAGITGLGGENIARGQADAAAVMQAWMDSPGHRANILNCDFKTLGVGVHFGSDGPWWTQDFGY
ncbi:MULTISPECIES: CAP domain-containing protein [unclassified Streptomyces]|uniref:CAP domain-containing protein n=1 Tax=unclassified Streptomyces TaxID=2593676 RepID=UPI00300BF2C5